jgi:hypothetical protein
MSDESDEVDDAILDVAKNPKRAKGDEGEIEEHDLDKLIKASKYLANKTGVTSGKGFTFTKIIAPGSDT